MVELQDKVAEAVYDVLAHHALTGPRDVKAVVDATAQAAIKAVRAHEGATVKESLTVQEPEWIEWGGGDIPVKYHSVVEVRFRCGQSDAGYAIDFGEEWPHINEPTDIMAYRVIK